MVSASGTSRSTTGWYSFILINVFYGEALTMFFVAEVPLSFDSIVNAVKACPEWKVLVLRGERFFSVRINDSTSVFTYAGNLAPFLRRAEHDPVNYAEF